MNIFILNENDMRPLIPTLELGEDYFKQENGICEQMMEILGKNVKRIELKTFTLHGHVRELVAKNCKSLIMFHILLCCST